MLNSLSSHLGGQTLVIPHMTDTILWDIRLPRLMYSILTGIGLSAVGLLMQTVTRNALADPYVLGVSSGASTGAVFAIISGGLPLLWAYNTPFFGLRAVYTKYITLPITQ